MNPISENYRRLLDRIGQASLRSGRSPEAVRLVGVTKRVAAERVREAVECGLTDIGENWIQEAEEKFPLLEDLDVTRHFIGHLQSNKARKAVGMFSWIQSIDSPGLAERIGRLATEPIPVMIQVQVAPEDTKNGADPSEIGTIIETVRANEGLNLRGLMTIPPFSSDTEAVRPFLARLRSLADQWDLPDVSMGMSHDFEVAIEEGATIVRVGTALFGARQ